MSERLTLRPRDIERRELQDRLVTIGDDERQLQDFVGELYNNHPDNPQIFYMAAVKLTSLAMDLRTSREENGDIAQLPNRDDAMMAFSSHARLVSELHRELHSDGPQRDRETRDNLLGAREEIIFNGIPAYAAAHGADFVVLPSRAEVDFGEARRSSDIQIYFPQSEREHIDAQIKSASNTRKFTADYYPHIALLSLNGILGFEEATRLRDTMKVIGERDDPLDELPPEEHEMIMYAAGAIVHTAHEWVEDYERRRAA
jgi:hypothetical protein